jgi:hypothetical protein
MFGCRVSEKTLNLKRELSIRRIGVEEISDRNGETSELDFRSIAFESKY